MVYSDSNFNLNMLSDLEAELDYLTSIFDILSDNDELDEDFNNMQNKLNEHIENRDLKKYYEEILSFVDKVVSFGSISIKKAQVLLTYLSILFPSLTEGYAKEKLNMKDLVYYSSWDL